MILLRFLLLGWAWWVMIRFEAAFPPDPAALRALFAQWRSVPLPTAAGIAGAQADLLRGALVGGALQMAMLPAGAALMLFLAARFRRLPAAGRLLFSGVAGLAAGGLIGTGLALLGLMHAGVVGGLALAGVAAAARSFPGAALAAGRLAVAGARSSGIALTAAIAAALTLAAAIPSALAPETDPLRDSLIYHLAIAGRTALSGKLTAMPGNVSFYFPAHTEMIRAAGFVLGGEVPARLVNAWITVWTSCLMAPVLGGVLGAGGGWLAAALYATHPLVVFYAGISKADAALAPVGLCAALAVMGRTRGGVPRMSAVAGVLAGTMAAVKTSAGIYLPLVAAAAYFGSGRDRRERLRAAAAVGLGAGAMLAPHWCRLALETGNPLYPFAGRVFGWFDMRPAEWDATLAYAKSVGQRGFYESPAGRAGALWTLSFADGLSPAWLAGWPLALAGGAALARWWGGAAGASFLVWLVAFPKLHYLFPMLAIGLVAVAAGAGLPGAAGRFARLTGLAVVLQQALHALSAPPVQAPLRAGLGLEDPAAYVDRRLPVFADALRETGLRVPPSGRVLIVGERMAYPLAARRRVLLPSCTQPMQVWDAVDASRSAPDLGKRIRQLGITHVLHNPVSETYFRGYMAARPWTRRRLAVWSEWWRAHARLVWASPRVDTANGAFLLYEIAPRPGPVPVTLPGTAGVFAVVEELIRAGRLQDARVMMEELRRDHGMIPGMGYSIGTWVRAFGDPADARAMFERAADGGLRITGVLEDLAVSWMEAGDLRTSARWAARLFRVCDLPEAPAWLPELLRRVAAVPYPGCSTDDDLELVLNEAARLAERRGDRSLAALVDRCRSGLVTPAGARGRPLFPPSR